MLSKCKKLNEKMEIKTIELKIASLIFTALR
jgi:hypothetical protein